MWGGGIPIGCLGALPQATFLRRSRPGGWWRALTAAAPSGLTVYPKNLLTSVLLLLTPSTPVGIVAIGGVIRIVVPSAISSTVIVSIPGPGSIGTGPRACPVPVTPAALTVPVGARAAAAPSAATAASPAAGASVVPAAPSPSTAAKAGGASVSLSETFGLRYCLFHVTLKIYAN